MDLSTRSTDLAMAEWRRLAKVSVHNMREYLKQKSVTAIDTKHIILATHFVKNCICCRRSAARWSSARPFVIKARSQE
jgi:hypothetical protein